MLYEFTKEHATEKSPEKTFQDSADKVEYCIYLKKNHPNITRFKKKELIPADNIEHKMISDLSKRIHYASCMPLGFYEISITFFIDNRENITPLPWHQDIFQKLPPIDYLFFWVLHRECHQCPSENNDHHPPKLVIGEAPLTIIKDLTPPYFRYYCSHSMETFYKLPSGSMTLLKTLKSKEQIHIVGSIIDRSDAGYVINQSPRTKGFDKLDREAGLSPNDKIIIHSRTRQKSCTPPRVTMVARLIKLNILPSNNDIESNLSASSAKINSLKDKDEKVQSATKLDPDFPPWIPTKITNQSKRKFEEEKTLKDYQRIKRLKWYDDKMKDFFSQPL